MHWKLGGQYSKTLNFEKVVVHDPPPKPYSSYGGAVPAYNWIGEGISSLKEG